MQNPRYISTSISLHYYPFGMLEPNRVFAAKCDYRFGFNGKLKDDDVEGEGNWEDYGLREYLPSLGKFISVDPLTRKYPFYTPYQFSGNKPLSCVDIDGGEDETWFQYWFDVEND